MPLEIDNSTDYFLKIWKNLIKVFTIANLFLAILLIYDVAAGVKLFYNKTSKTVSKIMKLITKKKWMHIILLLKLNMYRIIPDKLVIKIFFCLININSP